MERERERQGERDWMNETPAQMSPVFDVVEPVVARRVRFCKPCPLTGNCQLHRGVCVFFMSQYLLFTSFFLFWHSEE